MFLGQRGFRVLGRLAVLLGALAAALPAQPAPASSVKDPGPATPHLRILSYNIHHAAGNETCTEPPDNGDCGLNLRRIASILRDSGADIIGLQEVDRFWKRSGLTDQPRELGDMLGMFVCFGANLRLSPEAGSGKPREYGTLLLSRYPLHGCRNDALPKAEEKSEQRGLLRADVQTPGGRMRVMVTHLSTAEADRTLQAQAMLRALKEATTPTVLLGDMNAQPGEAGFQPVLRQMSDVWSLPGVERTSAPDGATFPCHPAQNPTTRIDYILLSAGLSAASAEVLTDANARMASDHCPLLVRVATPISPGSTRRR